MNAKTRKRFWKTVTLRETQGGFAVDLDGRSLKTPGRAPLVVPTRALAEMIGAEWDAQGDEIRPETMPATRAANAAIDKVRGQFAEVAALLTAYGETDLLCHRAQSPAELVARQAAAWDPLLDWSTRRFGVAWRVTTGVMPVTQPPETLARIAAHVAGFSAFALTAFHDLVTLPGSLVIGLAASERIAETDDLWRWSRIDEDWQIEQWGADQEAREQADFRRDAFFHAARFLAACA